mgnify:CR=1 FL=1
MALISNLSHDRAVRKRKDSHNARDLARERMERLFLLAEEAHLEHPERSNRYVQIARRISTRTRVRMPSRLKHLFCRHCGSYLAPDKVRMRLRQGILTATCLSCGQQTRRPYRPVRAGAIEASIKRVEAGKSRQIF